MNTFFKDVLKYMGHHIVHHIPTPKTTQSFLTGPDARKLLNNFLGINTTTQHSLRLEMQWMD